MVGERDLISIHFLKQFWMLKVKTVTLYTQPSKRQTWTVKLKQKNPQLEGLCAV